MFARSILSFAAFFVLHLASARFWVGVPSCDVARLREALRNVSSPDHPQYAQFLTYDQVAAECSTDVSLGPDCHVTGYGDAFICDDLPSLDLPDGTTVVNISATRPVPRHRRTSPPATGAVTPEVYRSQYDIPDTALSGRVPVVGIAEFQQDASFDWNDIASFCEQMGVPKCPKNATIVGTFGGTDVEATLDVQTVIGAMPAGSDIFYGTYDGWIIDMTSGMAERLRMGQLVPDIISISWGWNEAMQCDIAGCNSSAAYVERANEELMKLALQGITVVVSSGDAGCHGRTDESCSDNRTRAVFPGGSPYVLSVGGTFMHSDGTVNHTASPYCRTNDCVASRSSEDVSSFDTVGWTSGGGFSQLEPRMAFQSDHVDAYLAYMDTLSTKPVFTRTGRAYPDITAVSHNFAIVLGGDVMFVDGTSASAPLVAGMLAHIIATTGRRLGLVAPMLYSKAVASSFRHPGSKNSSNACTEDTCVGCVGFTAGPDALPWNPVFGLGTLSITGTTDQAGQNHERSTVVEEVCKATRC